ncbi:hypothetical protein CDIK_3625, partial [Cucumispora dikerogammari]
MIYVDIWTVFYDLCPAIVLLCVYVLVAYVGYLWTTNDTSNLDFNKKQDSKASNKDKAIALKTTKETKQFILSSYVDAFIKKFFKDKKNNQESNVNDFTLSLLNIPSTSYEPNDILCPDNNKNDDQNEIENKPLSICWLPLNDGFNLPITKQNTVDPYTESPNESYYDCVSTFQSASTSSDHQSPISPNIYKCSLSGSKSCYKPICTS